MSPGDLVVVKEGCGDEGQVGVCDVLFPDGVKHLNAWWLERLEVPDANR
jgi:hypothetical protein